MVTFFFDTVTGLFSVSKTVFLPCPPNRQLNYQFFFSMTVKIVYRQSKNS